MTAEEAVHARENESLRARLWQLEQATAAAKGGPASNGSWAGGASTSAAETGAYRSPYGVQGLAATPAELGGSPWVWTATPTGGAGGGRVLLLD